MINTPLVSVIVPIHNRQKYLARAIASIQSQTYGAIEIIAIDDASQDGSHKAILDLVSRDSRIVALRNEKNVGLVATLNRGLAVAKGKYIARLDDHDYWHDNEKLSKQVDFLETHPEYGMVGGGAIVADDEGREIARYLMPRSDEDIRKNLLIMNGFVHVSVLLKKELVMAAGGYEPSFDGLEDWNLWLAMGRFAKIYNIPEFLVTYTGHAKHNSGYAANRFKRKRQLSVTLALIKKYRRDYPGYAKAVLFAWITFAYSFMPYRYAMQSLAYRLKTGFLKIT
ncbi:glycosyltransferase [Candidatus Parcubacteria bacterium]|nr:glycosyltransferase [Candidatus Parcubacteria bacterium]